MNWNLFIDDERNVNDPFWMQTEVQTRYANEEWEVCRTLDEVKVKLHEKGSFPSFISFDHDLGYNQPTGYDIAKYLVDLVLSDVFKLSDQFSFVVHSQNPIGKVNIESYLNNFLHAIRRAEEVQYDDKNIDEYLLIEEEGNICVGKI